MSNQISQLIRQAQRQDIANRPTVTKLATELQIGDIIMPVQFRSDSEHLQYVGFMFDNTGGIAYSDEELEETMTITGIRIAREDDGVERLTLWAEMLWYGEPNEDHSGNFVYRRNCTGYPPRNYPYKVLRSV